MKDLVDGITTETILVVAEASRNPVTRRSGLSVDKIVEAGVEEGNVLKVETYLDFIKTGSRDDEAAGVEATWISASSTTPYSRSSCGSTWTDPESPVVDILPASSVTVSPRGASPVPGSTREQQREHREYRIR